MTEPRAGLAGRLAAKTINSRLTVLGVGAALVVGVASVLTTPREEEPQIIVPMVDVFVPLPGASPAEVESEVTTALEHRLWGIPGVEYVYSTSASDGALLTARFKVNEPLEPSLVKVRQELEAHPELFPPRAGRPTVTLLSIDDVPVVTVTLHGGDLAPGVLRQLGQEVARELGSIPEAAQVQVLGGARRVVRVEPDPRRLRELDLSLGEIRQALQATDAEAPAGSLVDQGKRVELSASSAVSGPEALQRLVVARRGGRPVLLGDVAQVTDGPERDPAIVLTASREHPGFEQAVSVDVAKRRGANATILADQVNTKLQALRGGLIPASVHAELTRNSGETARERSNELIRHLLVATFSVVALVWLAMGWRSAVVVGIAVPVTLALTLVINQLLGHTLNRITLFALIFSIGILVDDAIVVVENVHRHLFEPGRKTGLARTVLNAVDEVGNPTILATFAVIAAILPMAFVRGLMGPYMRPIPTGASLAMLFSLAVAFVVAPWAALRLLGHDHKVASDVPRETWSTRLYRRIIRTLLHSGKARLGFLALILALFAGAVTLVGIGFVRVKMLPFDNKSEFQVFVDLPAGGTREQALAVGERLGRTLMEDPDVHSVQVHSLTPAPFTFVGLVRHSFLRGSPEQVDLAVQLASKHERKRSSHQIASALRPKLTAVTAPLGARLRLVEIPPGPPVLATLVAEIYGPSGAERDAYAAQVRDAFRSTPGVVDVDSSLEPVTPRTLLRVDRERAALQGVNPAAVVEALALTQPTTELGTVRTDRGTTRVPIVLGLAPAQRARLGDLLQIPVQGERGAVPLETLVRPAEAGGEPSLPQEPGAGELRLRRALGEGGEPGLRADGPEPEARRPSPARRDGAPVRPLHARRHREAVDEVGRRVAHHAGGVPGPRSGLRRGAGADLRPGRRLVRQLRGALGGAAADPPQPDRHPAGARPARGVLHRHQHDRLHRRGRHHRPEQHHPGGLHPPQDFGGDAAGGGGGGGGCRPLPADAAHRGGGGRGERSDAGRSHLPGAGDQHDGRRGGGDAPLTHRSAGPLHRARAPVRARAGRAGGGDGTLRRSASARSAEPQAPVTPGSSTTGAEALAWASRGMTAAAGVLAWCHRVAPGSASGRGRKERVMARICPGRVDATSGIAIGTVVRWAGGHGRRER